MIDKDVSQNIIIPIEEKEEDRICINNGIDDLKKDIIKTCNSICDALESIQTVQHTQKSDLTRLDYACRFNKQDLIQFKQRMDAFHDEIHDIGKRISFNLKIHCAINDAIFICAIIILFLHIGGVL